MATRLFLFPAALLAAIAPALVAGPPAAAAPPGNGFALSPWAALPEPSGLIRPKLAPPKPDPSQDFITVYAHRNPDAAWRGDLAAGTPGYESGASAAATPMGRWPEYSSPENERLVTTLKQQLGTCGALGGLIQCPNPPP